MLEQHIKSLLGVLQKERIPLSKEVLSFDDAPAVTLTVPTGATYAEVSLIASASVASQSDVARFWLDGSTPTATQGLSRNNYAAWDIAGGDALTNFKIIGVEVGKTHVLNVQYFK